MSTPLPSFVELMATLRVGPAPTPSAQDAQEREPSPPSSPRPHSKERNPSSPLKTKSTPALRETAAKQRPARYNPYCPENVSLQYQSQNLHHSYVLPFLVVTQPTWKHIFDLLLVLVFCIIPWKFSRSRGELTRLPTCTNPSNRFTPLVDLWFPGSPSPMPQQPFPQRLRVFLRSASEHADIDLCPSENSRDKSFLPNLSPGRGLQHLFWSPKNPDHSRHSLALSLACLGHIPNNSQRFRRNFPGTSSDSTSIQAEASNGSPKNCQQQPAALLHWCSHLHVVPIFAQWAIHAEGRIAGRLRVCT